MRKLATGLLSMQASNVPGSENVEVSEFKEEDAESANKSGFNTMEVDGFENLDHSGEAVLASNKFFNYRIGYEMKKELIKLNHALNGIGYKNLIKIAKSMSLYDYLESIISGSFSHSNNSLAAGKYYYNEQCIIKSIIPYRSGTLDDVEAEIKIIHIFNEEPSVAISVDSNGISPKIEQKSKNDQFEIEDSDKLEWKLISLDLNDPTQNSISAGLKNANLSDTIEIKEKSIFDEGPFAKYADGKTIWTANLNSQTIYLYFPDENSAKFLKNENWIDLNEQGLKQIKELTFTPYATLKKEGSFGRRNIIKYANTIPSPVFGHSVEPIVTPSTTPPAPSTTPPAPSTTPPAPSTTPPAPTAAGAGASTTPVVKKVVIPKGMYHKWYQDSWGYYWPQDKDVVLVYKKDADGKADFSERGQQHVSTAYKNWNKFVGKLIKLTEISDPRPATPAATPAAATPAATPAAATPAASSSPVQPTAGGTVTTTVNGKEAVSIGAFGHDELFLIVESVSTGNPEIFLYDANKRVYSKMGDDQIGRWRKSLSRREINYLSKALEGKLSPKQIEGFKRFMNLSRRDSWLPFGDKKIKERMFDAQRDMKSTSARQNRLDKLEKKGVI